MVQVNLVLHVFIVTWVIILPWQSKGTLIPASVWKIIIGVNLHCSFVTVCLEHAKLTLSFSCNELLHPQVQRQSFENSFLPLFLPRPLLFAYFYTSWWAILWCASFYGTLPFILGCSEAYNLSRYPQWVSVVKLQNKQILAWGILKPPCPAWINKISCTIASFSYGIEISCTVNSFPHELCYNTLYPSQSWVANHIPLRFWKVRPRYAHNVLYFLEREVVARGSSPPAPPPLSGRSYQLWLVLGFVDRPYSG